MKIEIGFKKKRRGRAMNHSTHHWGCAQVDVQDRPAPLIGPYEAQEGPARGVNPASVQAGARRCCRQPRTPKALQFWPLWRE